MLKLQYLTLISAIAILGLNNTTANADTSIAKNKTYSNKSQEVKVNSSPQNITSTPYLIAQKSSNSKKSAPKNEDMEMIEQIQKRDKKLEAFKDMLKIDGVVPEVSEEGKNSVNTGDEMMDALQKRQNKIQNLKELKILQDKFNQEKIKELAKEDINLKNAEEFEELQEIINDESLEDAEILKALQKNNINIESIEKLQKIQKLVNTGNPKSAIVQSEDSDKLSATTAFRIFTIGIPATILVFFIATPLVKGSIATFKSNYDKKFGKPSIPERSLNLHNEAFQEISRISRKAKSIDDDKFGNEEFKTLIHFKVDVAKGTEGYKELNYKVELLRAAIVAQKSFLKLESAELRYRSRKQQEFYKYIADNLEEDLDKEDFAKKIKKKQAEILPLINTEEGREAIHSYAREINEISKYELGLKLLSLFKKYDLKDFSIIRDISGIVEGLQGSDLLEPKRLVLTVKEYYDVFEKIAPVLEISKAESTPATYARILQIVGLVHRHGDSYSKFKELIRLLHKWEQPHETVTMVREQFNAREYKLPPELQKEIPGANVHEKYAEYLADL